MSNTEVAIWSVIAVCSFGGFALYCLTRVASNADAADELNERMRNAINESKEIENSKEFYNDITADDRLQIEEILKEIFEQWYDQNICPSKDYSIIQIAVNKEITAEYFPYVTKNEIRKSIDLNEVEEAKADTKLLVEVLGVGGTQALTGVLADPVLSAEQKKATLKIVFGLSDDQASEMLQINQIP